MTIIIGLTGGIGSGKTTIMEHIQKMGITVYNAQKAILTLFVSINALIKSVVT